MSETIIPEVLPVPQASISIPQPATGGDGGDDPKKRKRHGIPNQLSTARIVRVLEQGSVENFGELWTRYAATSRGITSERIRAVQEFQKDGDRTKLKKRLGTKSDATANKTIGQIVDHLTRHPVESAEDGRSDESTTDYVNRTRLEEGMVVPASAPLKPRTAGEGE